MFALLATQVLVLMKNQTHATTTQLYPYAPFRLALPSLTRQQQLGVT